MTAIKIKGKLNDSCKIEIDPKRIIDWETFNIDAVPQIPVGSSLELTITFDEKEFISGRDGIVWATYNFRQAEVIGNALTALHINMEIIKSSYPMHEIFLIKVTNQREINDAVDFIWQSEDGLRLKPDWFYSKNENNKSFEKWLSGN